MLVGDVMTPDAGVDADPLLVDALREMRDHRYDQMYVRDAARPAVWGLVSSAIQIEMVAATMVVTTI